MSQRRSPKRQRKKEAAAARREAMRQALRRRRRARMLWIGGGTAALLGGGAALAAIVATTGRPPAPTPSPRPTPTPAASPAPIACDGKLPPAAGVPKPTFAKPEDQRLNPKKTYLLRLETSCGTIDIKLAVARAPKTVNSVVFLARKGFFDGLTFHRVARDFVIQGGDPKGDGTGGPGYQVVEPPPKGQRYRKGVVAMAKAGTDPPGASGSQFFIMSGDKGLPPEYALLGEVVAGMDVVDRINALGGAEGPPSQKVYIVRATVIEQ